jgi:hypothetical protein
MRKVATKNAIVETIRAGIFAFYRATAPGGQASGRRDAL